MPNLNVYLIEGYSADQKKQMLSSMTDAIVDSIGAPRSAVRIYLIEVAKANACVAGTTLADRDVDASPTIHALLIAGRTDAQKQALIAALTRVAVDVLGVSAEVVRVMLIDIPSTDFGMNGVTAASLGR